MENPKNWPPNNNIFPLFISFHINPSAEKELLKPESLNYLKQHEPIDVETLILKIYFKKWN